MEEWTWWNIICAEPHFDLIARTNHSCCMFIWWMLHPYIFRIKLQSSDVAHMDWDKCPRSRKSTWHDLLRIQSSCHLFQMFSCLQWNFSTPPGSHPRACIHLTSVKFSFISDSSWQVPPLTAPWTNFEAMPHFSPTLCTFSKWKSSSILSLTFSGGSPLWLSRCGLSTA